MKNTNNNNATTIIESILRFEQSLQMAVCWFSHKDHNVQGVAEVSSIK